MGSGTDSLIIFVKYPERGKVKSRLSAALDEETICELYKCFVEDLLQTVRECGFQPIVAFCPADAKDSIMTWLGKECSYVSQSGKDLGERMKNAFLGVFAQGYSQAVLIGSDIPDLSGEVIKDALAALRTHDAVIGPALDGGYYLIGFARDAFVPRLFDDVPWSTDEVFARTMDIFKEEGHEVCLMPSGRDIDRPEDVAALISRSSGGPFMHSKTMACLARQMKLATAISRKTEK
jgi:uncharacterized protein